MTIDVNNDASGAISNTKKTYRQSKYGLPPKAINVRVCVEYSQISQEWKAISYESDVLPAPTEWVYGAKSDSVVFDVSTESYTILESSKYEVVTEKTYDNILRGTVTIYLAEQDLLRSSLLTQQNIIIRLIENQIREYTNELVYNMV